MSEESVLSFRKLVSAMRTTEKEYWAHRDKKILRQSIELEKRVDGIIMKADGNGSHSPTRSWSTPSSRPSRRKKPR